MNLYCHQIYMTDQMETVKQSVICDTNILQYLGNKHILLELTNYLLDLEKRKFTLSISIISLYELLSGATLTQEKKIVKTLNQFKKWEITEEVLITSSRLTTLYNMGRIPIQMISSEDKFIAATAILTGSLILTANVNDFPRPFFREAEEKLIFYKRKDKKIMLSLYLLNPNYPVINQRFTERPK